MQPTQITVQTSVQAPVEKVWLFWSEPTHITQWNAASDEWHSPFAKNDLTPGGKFNIRMEAKDGSAGFDFEGIYHEVRTHEHIGYTMGDGRKVDVFFTSEGNNTRITEIFEAEQTNPIEMQRSGWQAILDNFRKYAEPNL